MSLPNYLSKIKSSGVYRFVWDKSQLPPQEAETLRLVIGYSEKGPFNTPVYIESVNDFTQIYGNINKRLERKGVYFHRLAAQALQSGPILALNLKPLDDENIGYISFNAGVYDSTSVEETNIKNVFNTRRFWSLDADSMVTNIENTDYITIASTDSKENSATIVMRKVENDSYRGITVRSWYTTQGLEMPEYLESVKDEMIGDYFAEIYVFRGDLTDETLYTNNGVLVKYMNEEGNVKKSYSTVFGESDALTAMSMDSNSNFIGSYNGILLPNFKDANGNYISLDIKFNADNSKHKMLMKLDETKLEDIEYKETIELLCMPKEAESFKPFYINGYNYSLPTTGTIYENCMNVIVNNKGIHDALTNRVDVEYHYIVDTFDGGPVETKKALFKLAQEKDNAFAIVNFPKMSIFDIKDNDLTSAVEGFKLNMPSEVEGASYGAYYTQLIFSDGTIKSTIPSAALVSNLFMDKWFSRQPYFIVAGPNYGRLSYSGLVGPDFNFGRKDLDVLEPMGVNAIVYVPRKGTYINSNQTAKQIPVSGLSKIHIRELIIYLQNSVESMLQNYQWELNTQPLRDVIKAKADAICETIKNNGGIYEYVNICNETNNTPEVIDNEMIILDTEIEPARGAGKMVHQLTIHKTGALSSAVK